MMSVNTSLMADSIIKAQPDELSLYNVGIRFRYFTTFVALAPRTSMKIPFAGFSTFTP